MSLHMFLQTTLQRESSITDITFERFVTRMNGLMQPQVEFIAASFVAK